MEIPEQVKTAVSPTQRKLYNEKEFFPSGAIAFFVVLVLLGLIIWFGIYFLMIERS